MFESILNGSSLTYTTAILCIVVSLILGITIGIIHMYTSKCSKNFVITLSLLPLIVQIVIMMVNGNLGTSVAVLGAFSLVRFRSIPGNSREILSVFFAMSIGLAIGMGQVLFAVVCTVIIGIVMIILVKSKFGDNKNNVRILKIVIPEDLDYTEIFDDVFDKYLKVSILNSIKTINMGSMFELNYEVTMNNNISEKEFIDELRVRNGNLKIILSRTLDSNGEL